MPGRVLRLVKSDDHGEKSQIYDPRTQSEGVAFIWCLKDHYPREQWDKNVVSFKINPCFGSVLKYEA